MVVPAIGARGVARVLSGLACGVVLVVGPAGAPMVGSAANGSSLASARHSVVHNNPQSQMLGQWDRAAVFVEGTPAPAKIAATALEDPPLPDKQPDDPDTTPDPDTAKPEDPDPETTDKPDPGLTENENQPTATPPAPTTAPATTSPPDEANTGTATPTQTEQSVSPSGAATESPTSGASDKPTPNSPKPSQRPASPPAALDSAIPTEMVVAAVVVLLLAILLVVLLTRRSRRSATPGGHAYSATAPGGPEAAGTWSGGGLSSRTMPLGTVPDRVAPTGKPQPAHPFPAPDWPPGTSDLTAPLPAVLGPTGSTSGAAFGPSETRPSGTRPSETRPSEKQRDNSELMSFLVELGGAMIDSGDPVTHVIASLSLVARANGVPDAEVVVMATALFVSVPGETVSTAVAAAGTRPLRLEQIDAVFEVVHAAERGEIGPAEGMRRLAAAREMPPSFSREAQVGGYVVFTLGLSLIMQSSMTEIALAGALGAAVGLLEQWASRFSQPFQVFLPVGSAFGVSVAVFLLGRLGMDVSGFTSLIAPLVTFIPGALLTTGVIELATGQIVSGSGRLAAGAMRLVLLALGILSAAQLVGVPATNVAQVAPNPLGELSAWVGVAVFGLGIVVNRCARREALPWIIVILYVAYAGQVLGGLFFGASLAAFCGAVVMTPVAMFVASQKSGPTTLVSFLPGFWILVPGSVGLVGVTNLLGEQQEVGFATLMSAGATMVSIALGVMLGLAVAALLRRPIRLGASGQPDDLIDADWTGTLIGLPSTRD